MLRFILGSLASIGVVMVGIVIEGGNLLSYFALTAFAICILVPFFATLAVWSLAEWFEAWRDAFATGGQSPSDRLSASVWAFSEKAAYAAGGLGFIAGLVLLLSRLRALSELGPLLAIGLTSLLYAILIGLVCRILRARVEAKADRKR